MEIEIPLEKMTTSDKLRILELIWDDLQRKPETVPSPSWHADVLETRKNNLEKGTSTFIDWDKAKRSIRESLK